MIISPSAISPYKIPTFQSGGGSGFDPDAQAFIDAVGADATISEYINTMFLGMKGEGTTNGTNFYSKLYAVYPMAPSDASTISLSTIKWNAVNPLDTDAAFRLTFLNEPTADLALGLNNNATPNGYAETHFIESANMTAGNNGSTMSVSRQSTVFNSYSFGINVGATFAQRITSTHGVFSSGVFLSTTAALDVYTASRLNATDFKLYRNGTQASTSATSASTQSTGSCFILALNGGAPSSFFDGAIDFVVIHDGLTANESQDLYDVINTWKTNLGR
jgi:hypothetical protein